MDINQFFRVAESNGLDAINLIRKSTATSSVPQMSRLTPRPEDVMSVRPTGPQMTSVKPRPEQVMSRVSIVYTQPAIKPLVPKLYTSMVSVKYQPIVTPPQPQTIKIELDPNKIEEERMKVLQEFGERVKYNWNKLSTELSDFLQKSVGPAIAGSVEANAALDKKVIEKASQGKLNELTPEDFGKASEAEAKATLLGTLGTLQTVALPTEAVIQRSLIQPSFQNWKLDQAEKQGIQVTPEQRKAADLGDLNLSYNDILKKQKIEINDTMSNQEKKIIEQANSDFFWREVLDTSVSLVDLDTFLGILKAPKAARSLYTAVKISNAEEVINDIARLAVKGDKEAIETKIGRKLTDVESNRIDDIAKNPEAKNADNVIGKVGGEDIDASIKDASDYNKELNLAREMAAGKKKTALEKVKDIWSNYKTLFESSTDEFFDLVNKIEKQIGEIKPSENPLYFFDALYKSARQAELFAKDNGFVDILKKASQLSDTRTAEEFGNFLLIRRKLKLKDIIGQEINNEKRARNFFNQYSKKYSELAKEYDVYMNKLVTYAQKNGLISADEYERLTKLEDYTPFYTIFDMTKKPEPAVLTKKKVGGVGGPIVQKKKTTEDLVQENPVIASLFYTYKVIDQVNKNRFSSKIGEMVRKGLIEDASIAVDATNVIRRNNLLQDIKELKKVQNRVTNVLTKKNVQWKMVAKELNALAKRGMNISLNMKDAPVDNAFLRRVEKKINDRLEKKQNLLQEIDDLNAAGLDFSYVNMDNEQANRDLEITNKFTEKFTKKISAKQDQIEELTNDINDLNIQGLNIKLSSGQETLSQSGFNTRLREKIQNKIIKKEDLIEDLLNSTDETVRNRLNKYLSNITGEKYTKKKID